MSKNYRLPLPNPNLVDGFGSLGFWSAGRWVKRVRPHQGVDFPAGAGTAIAAIADGRVADVVHSSELGWITVVRHERTTAEKLLGRRAVYSFSCHQSDRPDVKVGWTVQAGQAVGRVGVQGRNGSAAKGEHLHLAMAHDVRGGYQGRVFDPMKFIRARTAAAAAKAKKPKTYKIQRGDTLDRIANKVRVPADRLVQLNGIANRNHIEAGAILRLS